MAGPVRTSPQSVAATQKLVRYSERHEMTQQKLSLLVQGCVCGTPDLAASSPLLGLLRNGSLALGVGED